MSKVNIFKTDKRFALIYADPPWKMEKIKRKERPNQVGFDYPVMSLEDIKSLPIRRISEDNCMLFLWTVQKMLPDALDVMDYWGFKYFKTITWDKQNGMTLHGFHNRTEFLLVGYKGKAPELFRHGKAVPTIISESNYHMKHSEKPKQMYNWIQPFSNGGNCIELFARNRQPGWDCWGNEV